MGTIFVMVGDVLREQAFQVAFIGCAIGYPVAPVLR